MENTYTDSRGAAMPQMDWSEALDAVWQLASQNQLDEGHAAGSPELQDMRAWQQEALDTLHDLVVNHGDELDALEASDVAGDWPEEKWRAAPKSDAGKPANAIRICLDLAEQAAMNPSEARDPETADMIDRQQQAFHKARDLLGMHGDRLEQAVTLNVSGLG